MGFTVQRVYEAVDDPDDVYRDADGVWHIKAGARVRVRLTMVADNRRYHVALVDPLPAGLEIVNPALAVSQSVPQDPDASTIATAGGGGALVRASKHARRAGRGLYAAPLGGCLYLHLYRPRHHPGTFVAPPAKAEEMYSPEVFGRSGSDWVIVE
jgi:alpha-2-macroglobulin